MNFKGNMTIGMIVLVTTMSFLALISTSFAPAVTKTYDSLTKTFTFKLVGSPVANLTLVGNYCTGPTECFAILQLKPFVTISINLQDDTNNVYINKLLGAGTFRNFSYDVLTRINITKSYNDIACTSNTIVINATNVTNQTCMNNPYSITTEEQVRMPFNFFSFSYVANQNYEIRLKGNLKAATGYTSQDWILGFYGFNLTEWAIWSTNWSTSFADNVSQNVSATLSKFPYVINGTSGMWFNAINSSTTGGIQSDCDDLRSIDPTASFSNNISIEVCNTTQIVAWATANLNGTANSTVNNSLYAGNLTVLNESSNTNVWDSNYTFILHMSDYNVSLDNVSKDDSRFSNNATVQSGNVVLNTSCVFGSCLSFSSTGGSNDRINVTDKAVFSGNSQLTVEFWGLQRGWGAGQTPIGKHDNGVDDEWVFYNSPATALDFYVSTNDTLDVTCRMDTNAISTNAWHYYVGTYDGSAIRCYLDGQLQNTTAQSGKIQDGAARLDIGDVFEGSSASWKGSLDEIRLSNINRSAAYIQQNYIMGVTGISRLNPTVVASDVTAPTITIQRPNNVTNSTSPQPINFTAGDDTGISQCYWSNNNGANTSLVSCQNTTFNPTEGINRIRVVVNDTSNNTANAQINMTFDSIAPRITIQRPANVTNATASQTINFTVGDANQLSQCYWRNNNGANTSLVSCQNTTFTASEGINLIFVVANDTANNTNVTNINMTLDTIFPTCIIDAPGNQTFNSPNASLNVRCGDTNQLNTIFYSLNQGTNTTLFGNANTTILLADGFNHLRIYYNDSANNTNNSQVNLTLSVIIFNNLTRSAAFVNNGSTGQLILFNISVNTTGTIDRVLLETNSTNYTMTFREGKTYNFTLNVSTIAEGNYTVKFFANTSGNGTYQLNTSINSWFVLDASQPRLQIFKRFAGDSFLLNESYFNLTFNATDFQARNMTILVIRPDNGGVNQTLESTSPGNATIEINWTDAYRIGNYTINLTVRDEAGNSNVTQAFMAFGRVNTTLATKLRAQNFTSHDNAWGASLPITNNSQIGYTLYLDINISANGFLENRTPEINFRINDTFNNWTTVTIQNATGQAYTLTFYSNFTNFTSTRISTGESYVAQANVTSNVTINFSYQPRSGSCVLDSGCGTAFRYLFYNNFSRSFNAYIRFQLAQDQVFSKSGYHPRYFVCTAGATRELGCTTFTTAVDVTSSNNGDNGAVGYPVSMKEVTGSASASDLSVQTNNSIFLLEIGIPSGAFTQTTGGGGDAGGGGSGGTTAVQAVPTPIPEKDLCPAGYKLIKAAAVGEPDKCEIIGPPPAETFLTYMLTPRFGSIAPIHFVILIILALGIRQVNILTKWRRK